MCHAQRNDGARLHLSLQKALVQLPQMWPLFYQQVSSSCKQSLENNCKKKSIFSSPSTPNHLSRVFLDYHLDMQNRGRYVCYICGGNFEYQNQLDRHLIQHKRIADSGGEKYICQFCNLRFLDEDKLFNHCNYENHDWNQRRQNIEIDHSMTISNKVLAKRKPANEHKYQVKILKMVLKPVPTKRCTPMEKYRFHLPPHLRIPKRIGQVHFPYPSNPNCVGCL